jgi:hypothetical protein
MQAGLVQSLCRLLTAYANAGGPHHNGVCFGDTCPRPHLAAEMLGAEHFEI